MKRNEVTCSACGEPAANQQVSLGAMHQAKNHKPAKKRKLSKDELALRITLIVVASLAVLAILCGIIWIIVVNWAEDQLPSENKITIEEQEELDINTDLPTQGIQNIALFGLDERGETGETVDGTGKGKSFHSDAIIILTIDRREGHEPKIKMSSLARDTLVYVEGYNSKGSMTKLTHAFDYGYRVAKSADRADGKLDLTEADYKRAGAKTAIKTINANFHMNITEYMYVNFVEFMDIIDYIGGVTINVQSRELNELNKHVRAMRKECQREIDTVSNAGEQTLSGGQALAYARIRKIDSDLKRANRQRDVLKAVFDKVKSTPLTKLPDVAGKLLSLCHTTLNAKEIIEMGTWAVTKSPEIVNYTLPDTSVNAYWIWEGTHPNYGWVWIYDLQYATYLLHDFIYDTNTAAEHPLPTMPNEPKVTNGNGNDDDSSTTTVDSWYDPPVDTTTDPYATGDTTTDEFGNGETTTDEFGNGETTDEFGNGATTDEFGNGATTGDEFGDTTGGETGETTGGFNTADPTDGGADEEFDTTTTLFIAA